MKRLSLNQMELVEGGSIAGVFCAGLGSARIGIAAWNAAVAAGVISAGTVATGGGLVIAIAAGCAVYGLGKQLDWF